MDAEMTQDLSLSPSTDYQYYINIRKDNTTDKQ